MSNPTSDSTDKNVSGRADQYSKPRPQVADGLAKAETEKPTRLKGKGNKRGRSSKGRNRYLPRFFPMYPLEEALQIPKVIAKLNSSNPWAPKDVANAIGISIKNIKFYYLTASSRDYGLTTGTWSSKEIALTDLGKRLVDEAHTSDRLAAIREALFKVDVFRAAYEYYKGKQIPEIKYSAGTLQSQFKLPPDKHEAFLEFYAANCAVLEKASGLVPSGVTGDVTNGDSTPIIVGEPAKKTALKMFVVMPFRERTTQYTKGFFDEVLKNLITPAGVEAGFKVETARREGSDIIQSTIVNELLTADLVIADLTEHNPNVLFELGFRIAFEKPIQLIRAAGTAPIFDVDAMLRVADYNPVLWKSTLQTDIPALTAHIRATWDSRDNPQTWLKLLKKA
jgi:hypothetical protein